MLHSLSSIFSHIEHFRWNTYPVEVASQLLGDVSLTPGWEPHHHNYRWGVGQLRPTGSGQRRSVIDRHPDLLHPALGQFQRHLRCCIRRPATPGGKTPSWGRRAAADPPGTKDRKGASACTRLGAPLRCFGKCALCGVSEDRRSGDTRQIELGSAWSWGCCTADYPALFRSSGMLQRSDSHAPNTRRYHLLLSCSVGMPHALPGLLRSDR